jgi:hypothetical protein
MRYAVVLAAIAALTEAQTGAPPKAECKKLKDIKSVPDPLVQFRPGTATFPCDMGAPIPYGKIPTGCAKLEIIVGQSPEWCDNIQSNSILILM